MKISDFDKEAQIHANLSYEVNMLAQQTGLNEHPLIKNRLETGAFVGRVGINALLEAKRMIQEKLVEDARIRESYTPPIPESDEAVYLGQDSRSGMPIFFSIK